MKPTTVRELARAARSAGVRVQALFCALEDDCGCDADRCADALEGGRGDVARPM